MTIEQQIKDSDDQFAVAFNQGDIAALALFHAEDALLLGPATPVKRGSEAVKSGFMEWLDAGWKNLSLTTIEIDSSGDLAYNVGQFGIDVPTSSGQSKRVTGNYVDIYKRHDDGTLKIHVTCFDYDEPLPD